MVVEIGGGRRGQTTHGARTDRHTGRTQPPPTKLSPTARPARQHASTQPAPQDTRGPHSPQDTRARNDSAAAPPFLGGVCSKRSKCTKGNCKAWRSHDAHEAPPRASQVFNQTQNKKSSVRAYQQASKELRSSSTCHWLSNAPLATTLRHWLHSHAGPKTGPLAGLSG